MKLYHSTPIENMQSIIDNGIDACVTDKITSSDEQITSEGVFGFDNIESAKEFGSDCCGGEYAIFSFDADNAIVDPEYDGDAFFTSDYICNINFEYKNI